MKIYKIRVNNSLEKTMRCTQKKCCHLKAETQICIIELVNFQPFYKKIAIVDFLWDTLYICIYKET